MRAKSYFKIEMDLRGLPLSAEAFPISVNVFFLLLFLFMVLPHISGWLGIVYVAQTGL